MKDKLVISPKTKVAELLATYPQLEDVLIEFAPAFQKFKNPILRNTIAKVASLQQAAAIGNCKIEDLINRLRQEVGQGKTELTENSDYNFVQPDWFDQSKVGIVFDVSEMLSRGEHPVHQVMSDLMQLESGKIYRMIAPFLPAPLIDKAISVGFKHYVIVDSEQRFNIYFYK